MATILVIDQGDSTRREHAPVVWPQHYTPACGQHHAVPLGHLLHHLLLAVAKTLLAFHIEDPGDVSARARLNLRVGVGVARPSRRVGRRRRVEFAVLSIQ